MSCLHALNITNAHVHFIKGSEFPIFDGSAEPILSKLLGSLVEQRKQALGIFIRTPLHIIDAKDGRAIWARPGQGFTVHTTIDFPKPIGQLSYSCAVNDVSFCAEIASARTFLRDSIDRVPLECVRLSRLRGLAGPPVDLCQAIVYDNRTYQSQLRFPDEPVRHKLLDFIGDIYTVGYPVKGEFSLLRPGHSFSLKFAELLWRSLKLAPARATRTRHQSNLRTKAPILHGPQPLWARSSVPLE
jgi:UDP-3-O-acyl-N-acetylglucosamine deacetylase